jgi:hypothetical protein
MKTLTTSEAKQWCLTHGIGLVNERPSLADQNYVSKTFPIPKEASRHLWFSRFAEHALGPWQSCLLWVTAWGIWQSSENWHLYYRLRGTYNDQRLIEEAPAHLFPNFESEDLITFLQIGIGAGWDMHVLSADNGRLFVSHDEWAQFLVKHAKEMDNIEAALVQA